MSKVRVHAYAELRQYTGGTAAVEVEVADGGTVASLLAQLGIPAERTKIVFVNSRAAELDRVLADGERVDLFSAIGGG